MIPHRNRPRIQLHIKFNGWELDSPSGDRIDMQPAPTPKSEGGCSPVPCFGFGFCFLV